MSYELKNYIKPIPDAASNRVDVPNGGSPSPSFERPLAPTDFTVVSYGGGIISATWTPTSQVGIPDTVEYDLFDEDDVKYNSNRITSNSVVLTGVDTSEQKAFYVIGYTASNIESPKSNEDELDIPTGIIITTIEDSSPVGEDDEEASQRLVNTSGTNSLFSEAQVYSFAYISSMDYFVDKLLPDFSTCTFVNIRRRILYDSDEPGGAQEVYNENVSESYPPVPYEGEYIDLGGTDDVQTLFKKVEGINDLYVRKSSGCFFDTLRLVFSYIIDVVLLDFEVQKGDEKLTVVENENNFSSLSIESQGFNVYVDGVKENGGSPVTLPYEITGLTNDTDYEIVLKNVDNSGEETFTSTPITQNPEASDNEHSLSFDGVNDYVLVGNEAVFDITGDLTMVVSVKPNTDNRSYSFFYGGSLGNPRQYTMFIANDDDFVRMHTDSGNISWNSIPNLVDGNWHTLCIVVRADDDEAELFIDGVSEGVETLTGGISSASGALFLNFGRREPNDFHWDGLMDEWQLWNIALSDAQRASFVGSILNGDESGLVGYWNCEDEGSDLTDLTSNNNHGSISGATYSTDAPST